VYAALDAPFAEATNGFAGAASDGLTQLDASHALTTSYTTASNGNVVQTARVAGSSNPYRSKIEAGLTAPSRKVLDGMAGARKVAADALYEQAGMPVPGDGEPTVSAVLEAIDEDPRLTARQRAALKEVYQAFVAPPWNAGKSGR